MGGMAGIRQGEAGRSRGEAQGDPGMQRPRDTLPVLVYILEVDGRALHRGHGDPEHRKLRVAVAGGGAQLAGLFGNKLVVGAVLRALDVLRHLAIAVHCVEVHQHCGNASEPIGLDLQRCGRNCSAWKCKFVQNSRPTSRNTDCFFFLRSCNSSATVRDSLGI